MRTTLEAMHRVGHPESPPIRGGVSPPLSLTSGPRFSYRSYHHFTPFAETLFGVAHAGASIGGGTLGTSQNSFAMTIGGGVDYRINNRFSLRPLQVDYLLTRFSEGTPNNQTQNNLRASTGIVIHF